MAQGLTAISQKTTDDIAVENMLAPSNTQPAQEAASNDSLLNQTEPAETTNQSLQPSLTSTEQNNSVPNFCRGAIHTSSVRQDDRGTLLSMDELTTGSVVPEQRAVLSNIQNTGQPVQKLAGKMLFQVRDDTPDVSAPVQNFNNLQGTGSVSQNHSTGPQPNIKSSLNPVSLLFGGLHATPADSNENSMQDQRIHGNFCSTQSDSDHVQIDRNHVVSVASHVPARVSDETFDVLTNTSHVNETPNQSILGKGSRQPSVEFPGNFNMGKTLLERHSTSLNESRNSLTSQTDRGKRLLLGSSTFTPSQTNFHVNSGKNHVLSSSPFVPSISVSQTSVNSQTNFGVDRGKSHVLDSFTFVPMVEPHADVTSQATSTNIQSRVPQRLSHDDLPQVHNPRDSSMGQSQFNLIDFISNNSSERSCSILPPDVNANRETMTDSLANKTSQDGQTALLENVLGVPESLTLPLTPKGSCGSGYGLGLDVDEFLNSEDGQRM